MLAPCAHSAYDDAVAVMNDGGDAAETDRWPCPKKEKKKKKKKKKRRILCRSCHASTRMPMQAYRSIEPT